MKHMVALLCLMMVACSSERGTVQTMAACGKDTDCKGERICDQGACVAPQSHETVLPHTPQEPILTQQPQQIEGLPVCQSNDQRTPIVTWAPDVDEKTNVKNEPPSKHGDIVYVDISVNAGQIECDNEALNSFTIPYNENDVMEGGLAVNIRGGTHFANGTCYVRGYFLHESVPGMHQGWSEMYLGEVARKDIVVSPKFCMKE